MYQHITNKIRDFNKDPLQVALMCQKINKKRASQQEINATNLLFQTLYQHIRCTSKQQNELTMIALNHYELQDWYLIQSYYHYIL